MHDQRIGAALAGWAKTRRDHLAYDIFDDGATQC